MYLEKNRIIENVFLLAFWVRGVFGFVSEEIFPYLQNIESAVFLLYDAVIFLLGIWTLKNISDKIFVFSFIVVGYYVTCIHNGYSLLFYVNGLRDFLYILFLLPIYRYIYEREQMYEDFNRRFDRALYFFLLVQVVCIIFQFIKYGANDHGGGSLGNWNSGIISTMIYLISFYLIKRRIGNANVFVGIYKNFDLILLLIPTFLNETKISFLFLFCYFILLFPIKIKTLIKILVMSPVLACAMYIAVLGYAQATGADDDFLSLEYYTEVYLYAEESDDVLNWAEYLYETDAEKLEDIPRFTKYMLIPELNANYPGHDITGYGIGQYKGGTFIKTSKFYNENEWLLRGTVPYGFHLYIQLGIIGFILFIWFWVKVFRFRDRWRSIDRGIVIYIVMVVLLILFYNDSLRTTFMCVPMFYILFQSLQGRINFADR